jgi:enoyl-CoA hydratase/carnithine racemase
MIQGVCIGAGMAIASACDFRFAADNGRFGITASRIGLVYSLPLTELLVNLVGPSRAKDILMTGRLLEADEACQAGLADRVYAREEIEARTYEYAALIAERAQFSVRAAKKFVNAVVRGDEDPAELERMVEQSYSSEDYREGVKAFLEKRKPQFTYS